MYPLASSWGLSIGLAEGSRDQCSICAGSGKGVSPVLSDDSPNQRGAGLREGGGKGGQAISKVLLIQSFLP